MNRRQLTKLITWLRSEQMVETACPLSAGERRKAADWIETGLAADKAKPAGGKSAPKKPARGEAVPKKSAGIKSAPKKGIVTVSAAGAGKKPSTSTRVSLFTDGACRGNPGQSSAGIVIYLDGEELYTLGETLGIMTNNQAEYHALLIGLKAVRQLGFHNVDISMDSELIVRQLEGRYKVKNAALKPIYEQVRLILFEFKSWRIGHVPRNQNKIADGLANEALDSL